MVAERDLTIIVALNMGSEAVKRTNNDNGKDIEIQAFRCPNCGAPLKSRYLTNCPNCGVEIIVRGGQSFIIEQDVLDSGLFDPEYVWLMTDPVAKANFRFEGRLAALEQDIRFNVMRGRPWRDEDVEYMREIKRLLGARVIRRTTSYWYISPFQTIFRAMKNGSISVAGRNYSFKVRDEIVWLCRMSRESLGVDGSVFVGKLTPKTIGKFCKEMETAMKSAGRTTGMGM